MLTIEELKAALSEEIRIIRHLATKIDPSKLDWRPTEGQRSTQELLRYIALTGSGPVKALLAGDWDVIGGMDKELEGLDLAGFDAAMVNQERVMHADLDELGDSGLAEREGKLPWGASLPMSQAIFATSVRFLCAYRMQLFLYIKQSGNTEIGTANAWMGMDAPKPSAV
jgi:hypothetical protein